MNVSVITLACLCAGLLFDPAGFLRLALLASFIHEAGHIVFYIICKFKLPKLTLTAGGISLNSTADLTLKQDFVVTLSGPLFNFAAAIIISLLIQNKASYMLYFFAAVNICIGVYNLLPIGVLDGARLLMLMECRCKAYNLYIFKKAAVIIFASAVVLLCFILKLDLYIKIGLICSAGYLILKIQ